MSASKVHGALAEFRNPAELYHACEKVRDAGYNDWDSHSPFPIHGIEKAMGFTWSKVPWWGLVCGLSGAAGGFGLQVWVSTVASPLIISGKPLLSWPAYIPVTFELGIISTAIGTLVGMCVINRLPAFYHWLFHSKRFEKVTDDGFFISIESTDSKWDLAGTHAFLEGLGASYVELVEG